MKLIIITFTFNIDYEYSTRYHIVRKSINIYNIRIRIALRVTQRHVTKRTIPITYSSWDRLLYICLNITRKYKTKYEIELTQLKLLTIKYTVYRASLASRSEVSPGRARVGATPSRHRHVVLIQLLLALAEGCHLLERLGGLAKKQFGVVSRPSVGRVQPPR